jgi:hypothetical protein
MHGSAIPGRGSRAPIDITNDEAEQIAAMRRVPKIRDERGGDLGWDRVSEIDRLLAEKLLKRLEVPCVDALKAAVAEHGGRSAIGLWQSR